MDAKQTSDARRGLLGFVALVAPVIGVLVWWVLRSEPVSDVPGARLPVAPSSVQPVPAPVPSARWELAGDGVPIKPAGTASSPPGMMMHPHPLTPQHERLFRENGLIASLNEAMDAKDAAGLRRLLKQYREEYPEDANVLQDGYELVAACLERPGPETRAVAQRYYDERLDSGLRRYIRRHCLEGSN